MPCGGIWRRRRSRLHYEHCRGWNGPRTVSASALQWLGRLTAEPFAPCRRRLGQKDQVLQGLGIQTVDRFWEELARTLEQGPVLERSQELVAAFLEELKRNSMTQLRSQKDVDALIKELDGLNFNPEFSLPDLRLEACQKPTIRTTNEGRLISFRRRRGPAMPDHGSWP